VVNVTASSRVDVKTWHKTLAAKPKSPRQVRVGWQRHERKRPVGNCPEPPFASVSLGTVQASGQPAQFDVVHVRIQIGGAASSLQMGGRKRLGHQPSISLQQSISL
jgi:hypothetical protein